MDAHRSGDFLPRQARPLAIGPDGGKHRLAVFIRHSLGRGAVADHAGSAKYPGLFQELIDRLFLAHDSASVACRRRESSINCVQAELLLSASSSAGSGVKVLLY